MFNMSHVGITLQIATYLGFAYSKFNFVRLHDDHRTCLALWKHIHRNVLCYNKFTWKLLNFRSVLNFIYFQIHMEIYYAIINFRGVSTRLNW